MRTRLAWIVALGIVGVARQGFGADAPAGDSPPPPPPPPNCVPRPNGSPPIRILAASDPAAARRAEDHLIGYTQQAQPVNGETPADKTAREAQAAALLELARGSKVAAFDPALFEGTRNRARDALAAAEERLRLAKKAWDKPPSADERAGAQAAYCASLVARDQASHAQTKASEAVTQAAIATALSDLLPGRLEEALKETDANKRQQHQQAIDDSKAEIAAAKERAFDHWLEARRALSPAPQEHAQRALAESSGSTDSGYVLSTGGRLSWGVTGSLLRFRTERNPNLPGRDRNYRARFQFVPAEAGFQFLSEPSGLPWRLQLKNGDSIQIVSWGGMLLAGLGQGADTERGNLSMAGTLAFFENTIGLGIGFDLYRGIPIQGADGTSGSDTAFTGVLAWAFAPEGEVTPENAFVVVTINLSTLIKAISGEHEGE